MKKYLLAIVFLSPFTCFAEITFENLNDSIANISKGIIDNDSYQHTLESTNKANAVNLFYASHVAKNKDDVGLETFYFLAGQIRLYVDLSLIKSENEEEINNLIEKHQLLNYLNGAGDTTFYKDHKKVSVLIDRLILYIPLVSENYDPGWKYSNLPGRGEYELAIRDVKARRMQKILLFNLLSRNKEYMDASETIINIRENSIKNKRQPNKIESNQLVKSKELMDKLQIEIVEKIVSSDIKHEATLKLDGDAENNMKTVTARRNEAWTSIYEPWHPTEKKKSNLFTKKIYPIEAKHLLLYGDTMPLIVWTGIVEKVNEIEILGNKVSEVIVQHKYWDWWSTADDSPELMYISSLGEGRFRCLYTPESIDKGHNLDDFVIIYIKPFYYDFEREMIYGECFKSTNVNKKYYTTDVWKYGKEFVNKQDYSDFTLANDAK